MIIKRDIYEEIEKFLSDPQAIVITGLRRVGKTTLLRYFYERIDSKNKVFIDLENPLNRAIFEKQDYEAIKAEFSSRGINFRKEAYIFLDEVQLVKVLPSVVKYFYDHYRIKFFLSGSASFYLKNLFTESLAGRKYVFELFPLSFSEFLRFKRANLRLPSFTQKVSETLYQLFASYLNEYLLWGGMPEVVLQPAVEKKRASLEDIFSSYFQIEVRGLGDFRKNEEIKNLIFLLSERVGQKVDIKKVSSELGISRPTVYEYLEFLQGTYFIRLLPAKGRFDTALRKQRKVYFTDQGILNLFGTSSKGALIENTIFAQFQGKAKLYYYSQKREEIDFLIKKGGEWLAFEVKRRAYPQDFKRLKRISQKLGIKKSYIIAWEYSGEQAKYPFQLWDLL